ncbi:MAG: DUF4404 family protein [Bermanella sp.]
MHEQLKAKLAQLKESLSGIERLDDESRGLLTQLDLDIQSVLSSQQGDASLDGRLEQQAVQFEGKHPQMSAILRDIMDALSKMGI